VTAVYVPQRQRIKLIGLRQQPQVHDLVLLNGVRLRVAEVTPFDTELDAAPEALEKTSLATHVIHDNKPFDATFISISASGPAFGGLIVGRPDVVVKAEFSYGSDDTVSILFPLAALPYTKHEHFFFVLDGAIFVRSDDHRYHKRDVNNVLWQGIRLPMQRLVGTHFESERKEERYINIEFLASKETDAQSPDPFEHMVDTRAGLLSILYSQVRSATRAFFQRARPELDSLSTIPVGAVIVAPSGMVKAILYSADGRLVEKLDALPNEVSTDDSLYLSVLPCDPETRHALESLLHTKRLFKRVTYIERLGEVSMQEEDPMGVEKLVLEESEIREFEELYRVFLGPVERPYVTHVTFCDMTDPAVVYPHRRYQPGDRLSSDSRLMQQLDEFIEFIQGLIVLDSNTGDVSFRSVLENTPRQDVLPDALLTTRLGIQRVLAPFEQGPNEARSPSLLKANEITTSAMVTWLRGLREQHHIHHVLFFDYGVPLGFIDECVDERIRIITTGNTDERPLFSITTNSGVIVASRYDVTPRTSKKTDDVANLAVANDLMSGRRFLATPLREYLFDDRILWMSSPVARLYLILPNDADIIEQTYEFDCASSFDLVQKVRDWLESPQGSQDKKDEAPSSNQVTVVHASHAYFGQLYDQLGWKHEPVLVSAFDPILFAAAVYMQGCRSVTFRQLSDVA